MRIWINELLLNLFSLFQIVAALSQFGLVRSLRVANEKSYYVEFDTTYSAEQAVKHSATLTIDSQPIHCSFLITPPGLELPTGSSFSRPQKSSTVSQISQT